MGMEVSFQKYGQGGQFSHHGHTPGIFELQNQVVCPPVVAPGEFFVCTADVPRGSSLDIRVEMVMD